MKSVGIEKQRLLGVLIKRNAEKLSNVSGEEYERFLDSLQKIAEVRALRNVVIPEGFEKFSFDDFDGEVAGSFSLPTRIAAKAKGVVSEFCWDLPLSELSKFTLGDRNKRSVVGKKMAEGLSIVIHGDSPARLSETDGVRYRPIGRTFVAAILTREAISLKIKPEYKMLTFDWVEFASLRKAVVDDDNEKLADYQTADWLVIDNITDAPLHASQAAKDYLQAKLDPFFFYRLEYKRPTVLVFKFNVDKRLQGIEEAFGTAMSRIVGSNKTTRIMLSDKETDARR